MDWMDYRRRLALEASRPAQPAPNGQTVNYVVVNRPLGSIDCSYILDPSLRIPTRFLPALDVGESEADRKNLVLKSKLGTIVANIALYHQMSSPVTKRTTMEFKTTVGTMVLKIVRELILHYLCLS